MEMVNFIKTMTKITFNILLNNAKVVLSIFAIVGTFYAVFSGYRNFVDNQKTINKSVIQLVENDSVIFKKLEVINYNVETTTSVTQETKQKVDALQQSYLLFLKNNKALTKEEFLQYMFTLQLTNEFYLKSNEEEVKKNLVTQSN
jgi:hypothetical protein